MFTFKDPQQQAVANFMTTCKQWDGESVLSSPIPESEEELNTYKLRLKLCIEETFELFEAMLTPEAYASFQIQLDNINTYIDSLTTQQMYVDPIGVFDSLVDQQYVNLGFANLLGLNMAEGFNEVHRSNMTKLDENGQPIFREDGKLLKSDLYSPPNLHSIYNKD